MIQVFSLDGPQPVVLAATLWWLERQAGKPNRLRCIVGWEASKDDSLEESGKCLMFMCLLVLYFCGMSHMFATGVCAFQNRSKLETFVHAARPAFFTGRLVSPHSVQQPFFSCSW